MRIDSAKVTAGGEAKEKREEQEAKTRRTELKEGRADRISRAGRKLKKKSEEEKKSREKDKESRSGGESRQRRGKATKMKYTRNSFFLGSLQVLSFSLRSLHPSFRTESYSCISFSLASTESLRRIYLFSLLLATRAISLTDDSLASLSFSFSFSLGFPFRVCSPSLCSSMLTPYRR